MQLHFSFKVLQVLEGWVSRSFAQLKSKSYSSVEKIKDLVLRQERHLEGETNKLTLLSWSATGSYAHLSWAGRAWPPASHRHPERGRCKLSELWICSLHLQKLDRSPNLSHTTKLLHFS